MFGFPSSKVWAAAGVLLAVALIAFAGYGYGYGSGKADATAEAAEAMDKYKEEVRAREREQERLLAEANDKNREQEKAHDKRVADLRAEFARSNTEARERDARTVADLRAGNQRLRLQVTACRATPTNSPGGPAAGADGAGTAELAPETSAALWGIAADGDRAIRKLTALQAWARSAVQLCTLPQPENQQ